MAYLRVKQLDRYIKSHADNEVDAAYLLMNGLEVKDDKTQLVIQDDDSGSILFSFYDYIYDESIDVEEETHNFEENILEKYKSYEQVLSQIRSRENENLYAGEKEFSRLISF